MAPVSQTSMPNRQAFIPAVQCNKLPITSNLAWHQNQLAALNLADKRQLSAEHCADNDFNGGNASREGPSITVPKQRAIRKARS
jgi:hypothetical protein